MGKQFQFLVQCVCFIGIYQCVGQCFIDFNGQDRGGVGVVGNIGVDGIGYQVFSDVCYGLEIGGVGVVDVIGVGMYVYVGIQYNFLGDVWCFWYLYYLVKDQLFDDFGRNVVVCQYFVNYYFF